MSISHRIIIPSAHILKTVSRTFPLIITGAEALLPQNIIIYGNTSDGAGVGDKALSGYRIPIIQNNEEYNPNLDSGLLSIESMNLFNRYTVITDIRIGSESGGAYADSSSASMYTSDYIAVDSNTVYYYSEIGAAYALG